MRLNKEHAVIIGGYVLIEGYVYYKYISLELAIIVALPLIIIGILAKKMNNKDKEIELQTNQLISLEHKIEESQYLAHYDETTGLANRVKMYHFYDNWTNNNYDNKKMAVLFMDIDRFKNINDNNGHKFGDLFLKEFAERLRLIINHHGEVYRYAGDEFVVLIPYDEYMEVEDKVSSFLHQCKKPFDLNGKNIYVTSSVGISLYPEQSKEIDELIDYADKAMYQGKKLGRDSLVLYNGKSIGR